MNTISPEVKTALVTGTDHGVGFSLAKKLLSRGYFVIAVRVNTFITSDIGADNCHFMRI